MTTHGIPITELSRQELEQEHHRLEKTLGKLERHEQVNHDEIRELKKRKLLIKDTLTQLGADHE